MKKEILTLTITAVMAGAIIFISQPSSIKTGNAQEQMIQTKHQHYQAVTDSIQIFNNESEEKIGKYEMSIVEIKTRIANEKKGNKARYAKKVTELSQ